MKKLTHEQFIERVGKQNEYIEVLGQYVNRDTHINVRCKKCGHEWSPTPHNLMNGSGCPICSRRIKRTQQRFIDEMGVINPQITILEEYDGLDKKIRVRCDKCGHEWKALPHNMLKGSGCPDCATKELGKRSRKSREKFISELAAINPDIRVLGDYTTSGTKIKVCCNFCNYEWYATPNNLLKGSGCPRCSSYLRTSFPEQVVYYYIKQVYPDALNSFTDIFENKMELDVYIPSLRIGIEYDGAIWHHDRKAEERERKKYAICKNNHITLIRIKEAKNQWDADVSDCIVYAPKDIQDTLEKLREYLTLPEEINVVRDARAIRESYYGENNFKKSLEQFNRRIEEINADIEIIGAYINSSTPITIRCKECGYEWNALPDGLIKGHGCPRCAIKKRAAKKTKTKQEFIDQLKEINPSITIIGDYTNSHTKVLVQCKKCGNKWETTPSNLLRGSGCIDCSGYSNKRKTNEEFIKELNSLRSDVVLCSDYISSKQPIAVQCKNCGYKWQTTPSQILRGQKCPLENRTIPKTTKTFSLELKTINPNILVLGEYVNSKTPILVKCGICGHEWEATPNGLLNRHGCPKCYGNIKKTTEQFIKELQLVNPSIKVIGEYEGANTPISVECSSCGYSWKARPIHLLRGHGCPKEGKALRKTTAEFVAELHEKNPSVIVTGEYINTKTKIGVRCKNCNYEWNAVPNSLLKGHGCPKCAKKRTIR